MPVLNSIEHYLSTDGIRITLADVSDAAREAQDIHQLQSMAAVIMGKILTASAILAMDFKNHEGVSLKWVTGSPLGTIHSDAYEGRYVRGFPDHPECSLPDYSSDKESDYVSCSGKLFVTRYSLLKQPYVSAVNLSKGDVAECISEYINASDQTLSHVEIETKLDKTGHISRCSGFIAQLMPEGNKELFHKLFETGEKLDLWGEGDHSLTGLLRKEDYILLGKADISYRCTCSEDRIKNSLLGLPVDEQQSLLDDEKIEVVCHYCGKKYHISRETLKKWFQEKKGGNV